MHSSDAPAELPGSAKASVSGPAALASPAVHVAATLVLAPPTPPDVEGDHYLTLSAPLHILISQYLI